MLTEEVKTFIEILYLIIGYGPLRVSLPTITGWTVVQALC